MDRGNFFYKENRPTIYKSAFHIQIPIIFTLVLDSDPLNLYNIGLIQKQKDNFSKKICHLEKFRPGRQIFINNDKFLEEEDANDW